MKILQETSFKEHKDKTAPIVLKYQFFDMKKAQKMDKCGDFLEFAKLQHIKTLEQKQKLINGSFCRNRFCPMCNWRRARKLGLQGYKVLNHLEGSKKLKYLFATLTIKNPPIDDLKATISILNKAFNRLSKQKRFKDSFLGYLKSIEFLGDNTPKGQAHPHLHILLAVEPRYFKDTRYINQKELQAMWKKALQVDYDPSVDMRAIRPKKEHSDPLASVVAECIKYPIKIDYIEKMNDEDFEILDIQTKGLRIIGTGGIIKQGFTELKETTDNDDDLIYSSQEKDDDLWKLIEIIRYQYKNQNYQVVKTTPKS